MVNLVKQHTAILICLYCRVLRFIWVGCAVRTISTSCGKRQSIYFKKIIGSEYLVKLNTERQHSETCLQTVSYRSAGEIPPCTSWFKTSSHDFDKFADPRALVTLRSRMLHNQYSEDKYLKNPVERNWTKPMYNYFSVTLSEYRGPHQINTALNL